MWLSAGRLLPFLYPAREVDKYDAVVKFLVAAFIPMKRCWGCFLLKAVVLIFKKMGWLFAVAAGLTELGSKVDGSKLCREAEQQVYSALLGAFMLNGRAERLPTGNTILGGFVDHMFLPKPILEAAIKRGGFMRWS